VDTHIQRELFDREGGQWPAPASQDVTVNVQFRLRTADPGYTATVRIYDPVADSDLEWSEHELAYTIGGWAQAMSLVAWQLERGIHYLQTFD